jgi:hypothetical protein
MKTSGNRSIISRPVMDRTTRGSGLGLASAFLFLVLGAGSCSPGSLPTDFNTPITTGGTGGTGGAPPTGGTGGGGGMPPGPAAAGCGSLQVTTLADFETKFIAPKCGMGNGTCHQTLFPPKGLDKADMVSMLLVGQRGTMYCMTDSYINKGEWMKSYVWAKISASGMNVNCPSGGMGGVRMPFAMDPLTADQLDCFKWYITARATQ